MSDATRPFAFDAALGGRVVLLDGGCNSNEYLHVVAGDFDDDLDHDLMFAKNDQGATQLYSNGRIAGQRPQVWRVPGSRMIDPVVGGPGYTTSLTLGVQLPSGVIGQPGGPTHLEVLGWFFPQSSGVYEPHAALEHVLALPGNPSAPWQIPVSWTTDTLDPNGSAMLLSTRLVRLNGAQIERQWPADTTYYKYGPVGTLTLVSRVDFQTLANCVSTGGDIGEGTISSGSGSGGNPGPPPTPRR